MDTILWIAQILLALMFLFAGLMKATQPYDTIRQRMEWVNDYSATQVRLIGIVEVLGAVGLILPMVTGVLPWLTPLAAIGLALTMVGAMITHARRGESVVVNVVLLALTLFVAYGRFVAVPVVA